MYSNVQQISQINSICNFSLVGPRLFKRGPIFLLCDINMLNQDVKQQEIFRQPQTSLLARVGNTPRVSNYEKTMKRLREIEEEKNRLFEQKTRTKFEL